MSEVKILLISIGGASAPIINSILHHNPDKIIFFVSKTSRLKVTKEILPEIFNKTKNLIDHEFIVSNDEQDIGRCTETLLREIPQTLEKLDSIKQWPDIVDYTGGTKTMSAAMVWASSKFPCQFNYVGGSSRTKNGLGIVIDGNEVNITLQNPWNKLAYFEINDAVKLFNRGQYANSAELFADIEEKVTDDRAKRVFSILHEVVAGYSQWDVFDHKNALRLIDKNIKPLTDIAETERFYLPNLKSFSETVKGNFEFLQGIKPMQLTWLMIYDLLANALRRALLEKKYEDATARCYAAIEKIAKHELMKTYGINNSDAKAELIPDSLRAEYLKKYLFTKTTKDGSISESLQFGVTASFRILVENGNKLGVRFSELDKINSHLTERNYSILGHGMQPSSKQKFRDLFNDALFILDIKEEELPVFPVIN